VSRDHDPYEAPEPDPDMPEFTPGLAVWLTVSGSFLSFMLTLTVAGLTPGATAPAMLGIGTILGFGLAFALARPFIADPPEETLGFVSAPLHAWLAVALFLPALLLISELENLMAVLWPRPTTEPADESLRLQIGFIAQLILVMAIVTPVVHEIFFRGLLQPRLEPFWGSRGAVLGVALLGTLASLPLALASGQPSLLALPFGEGFLRGWLRRTAGSILPGLVLGVGFGVLHVLAMYEVFGIPGFDLVEAAPHTPLTLLTAPAMLLGIGLALTRRASPDRASPRSGNPSSDER